MIAHRHVSSCLGRVRRFQCVNEPSLYAQTYSRAIALQIDHVNRVEIGCLLVWIHQHYLIFVDEEWCELAFPQSFQPDASISAKVSDSCASITYIPPRLCAGRVYATYRFATHSYPCSFCDSAAIVVLSLGPNQTSYRCVWIFASIAVDEPSVVVV